MQQLATRVKEKFSQLVVHFVIRKRVNADSWKRGRSRPQT